MWYKSAMGRLVCCGTGQAIHPPLNLLSRSFFQGLFDRSSRRRFICSRETKMFEKNTQILWDYLRIDDPLQESDLIFVLGNQDLRTADHAADLYLSGFAPLVVVSGKHGHGTKGKWELPEAVAFSNRLLEKNVPATAIIIEPEATNTGENIIFTQKLLRNLPSPLDPRSIILVQTPFMGRRTYATFMKQWERAELVDVRVTSPPISLADYVCDHSVFRSQAKLVEEMVRNMQRILEYPLLGFQIKQEIPCEVMEAFQSLQLHFENI